MTMLVYKNEDIDEKRNLMIPVTWHGTFKEQLQVNSKLDCDFTFQKKFTRKLNKLGV